MPTTTLLTEDGMKFINTGTSAVTLTLTSENEVDADGNVDANFEAEWEVKNTAELVTIGANFLLWMDDVFKNSGVVENTIERFLRESGRLQNGVGRLKHTMIPGYSELPDRRAVISEYQKEKEKDARN